MSDLSIKRILIANRGEIALRIIRCCKDLGIESVAIYSDADEDSLHRKLADKAIRLAGRISSETYLNIPAIIAAAKAAEADAIHPGYGFLSENAEFSAATKQAGITFIGPSAEAISTMGDKVKAKSLMREHQVPVVPGSLGALETLEDLTKLTQEIGYPLILKAAAGGGGRGMRTVYKDEQLAAAFEACQREALAYFANPQVFAERYIEHPRHIEIQVLSDGKHAVHLFERDCSIQRRHQKLIEEAPSAYLSEQQRAHLGELAVQAALATNYQGAGTVEFICESPDRAYFMEMNTRIQVEHPITEQITGIDLIAEQIAIAAGSSLKLQQSDLKISGWAFEARINAENIHQGFAPSPGKISRMHLPSGPGVRMDTHIYAGYEIPSEYDSMIAKLICWGKDRNQALDRLARALDEMEIEGIPTTANFHRALIDHPDFRAAHFTTRFMEESGEEMIGELSKKSTQIIEEQALLAKLVDEIKKPKFASHTQNSSNWQTAQRLEAQNYK